MAENVIPMYSKVNLPELFINMNRTQQNVNKNVKDCLEIVIKKQERLKAIIIAMFIAFIGMSIGFGLAIHKLQNTPVTVYQTNSNQTVDITKLPLPPLEEIEMK